MVALAGQLLLDKPGFLIKSIPPRSDLSVPAAVNVPSFDKWIFPVIANMPKTDVIDQLASVQTMTSPASQIMYIHLDRGLWARLTTWLKLMRIARAEREQ